MTMVLLALAGTARADASIGMEVNAASHRGFISMFFVASPYVTDVTVGERIDGELHALARPPLVNVPATADHGPVTYGIARDFTHWKCSRTVRRLVTVGRALDGSTEETAYTVRTPSCANRLTLTVRPGEARLRDSWGLGGVEATVCRPHRCTRVALPAGTPAVSKRMRIRRGDTVTARTSYQHLRQTVGVHARGGPTVLTTGDSMMQSLDTVLSSRLSARANVRSDVHPGAALSSGPTVDWLALARRQVRRYHPRATIVFLGTNDLFPITRPDGTEVKCCGPDWGAAYERRARRAMRTYVQHGAGTVLWLSLPAARDEDRAPAIAAVNAALVRAADTVPGAAVVPVDRVIAPGGVYRDQLVYRGRRRRVRARDGVHLSLAGARIVADLVIRRLERLAVL
jgi:lysophospholipase L1-like esterase